MKLPKWLMAITYAIGFASAGSKETSTCKENEVSKTKEAYQPCDEFELVYGAATTETLLWFLAEEDHQQFKKTARCIKKLTSNRANHSVYYEAKELGKPTLCNHGELQRIGRECYGWDDLTAFNQQKALVTTLSGQSSNHLTDIHLYMEFFNKEYQRMKSQVATPNKNFKKFLEDNIQQNPHISAHDAAKWVLKKNNDGESFSQIFLTGYPIYENLVISDIQKYKSCNKKRNKSLLKGIHLHRKKGGVGVFWVGANHIVPPPEDNGDNSIDAEEIRRTLQDQEMPFAVLKSKSR